MSEICITFSNAPRESAKPNDDLHPFLAPLNDAIQDIERATLTAKAIPNAEKIVFSRPDDMADEIWDALWQYIRFTYRCAFRFDGSLTIPIQ